MKSFDVSDALAICLVMNRVATPTSREKNGVCAGVYVMDTGLGRSFVSVFPVSAKDQPCF